LNRVIVFSEKEKEDSDEVLGVTTTVVSSRSGISKSARTKSSRSTTGGGSSKWWRSADGQREKEKALRLLGMTLELAKLWDQSKLEERYLEMLFKLGLTLLENPDSVNSKLYPAMRESTLQFLGLTVAKCYLTTVVPRCSITFVSCRVFFFFFFFFFFSFSRGH
jgi:hypothetical protein